MSRAGLLNETIELKEELYMVTMEEPHNNVLIEIRGTRSTKPSTGRGKTTRRAPPS